MKLKKNFYNKVNTLQADAKNPKQSLDFILTETNNPHNTLTDSVNPALRLALFNRGGFNILDFNYLQPPLEEGKNPVTSLLQLTKIINENYLQNGIPKEKVLGAINSFFKYAFNINNPTQNTFYKQMETQINQKFKQNVTTIPYIKFMKTESQQNL